MKVSAIPNKLLAVVGLRVIRREPSEANFPIEISNADKAAFWYVRNNQLSTSSDERLFATIMACRYVVEQGIGGDFVECGVWRGGNSILAADVFKNMSAKKFVWLFDTFSGMTEPTSVDVNFRGESANIKFLTGRKHDHNEWCFAPLEEVQGNFARAGLLDERVRFVKGDVARTLVKPDELPQRISVLRLDTDWYESTRIELEALYPRLSQGGVLIIDDYGHWGGARQAVDEYFRGITRPFLQYIDRTARVGIKCD